MPDVADAVKRIEEAAKNKNVSHLKIDPITLSEFAFIQTQKRASDEISAFWNIRLEEMMVKTRKRLSIPDWHEIDWSELFSKEVIHVIKRPEPKPEVKSEPAKEPEKKEDHVVPANPS